MKVALAVRAAVRVALAVRVRVRQTMINDQ